MPKFLLAIAIATVIGVIVLTVLLTGENRIRSVADEPGESAGLAEKMVELHYFQRKLGYAVSEKNQPLASFYLHEIEETLATVVAEIPSYDGFPVGSLTEQMAQPALERLEASVNSVEKLNWSNVQSSYAALVGSCNACHAATEHGFINILGAPSGKPFDQDFTP